MFKEYSIKGIFGHLTYLEKQLSHTTNCFALCSRLTWLLIGEKTSGVLQSHLALQSGCGCGVNPWHSFGGIPLGRTLCKSSQGCKIWRWISGVKSPQYIWFLLPSTSFIKIWVLYLYLSSLKHKNKIDKHLKLGFWNLTEDLSVPRMSLSGSSWFILLKTFAFRRFKQKA